MLAPAAFGTDSMIKFRELSPEKVVYNMSGHTIVLPQQCTVTSELPVPRKGNPGTVKSYLNIRRNVVLDAGTDNERVAPSIIKIEVSFPLGMTTADKEQLILDTMSLMSLDNPGTAGLLNDGILPE